MASSSSLSASESAINPSRLAVSDILFNSRNEFLAGLTSSVISRLCIAPIDLVKIRVQTNNHWNADLISYIKKIYSSEGPLAFWRGNWAGEFLVIQYGTLAFVAYKYSKLKLLHYKQQHPSYYTEKLLNNSNISVISGASSGFFATLFSYPFDLLRTRFAIQGEFNKINYSSVLNAAKSIYRQAGISGFYVGLYPTVVNIIPLMAAQFSIYEGMKNLFAQRSSNKSEELSAWQLSASGFIAGVLSKFITMPLDVIKKRFQVHSLIDEQGRKLYDYKYTGVLHSLKSIYRSEGLAGLYRGSIPALIKAGPNSAIIYLVYEKTIQFLQTKSNSQ
jgi:solute carrier family 25 thiamine pyrophosphate transporter 19